MKAVRHGEKAKSPESRNLNKEKAGTTIESDPPVNRSMLDTYKRKKFLTEKRNKDSTQSHQELPVIKPVLRPDQMFLIPGGKCDSPKTRAMTLIQQQYLEN
jgi:hypothetical protein